jgi:hypothetical protein
MKKENLEGKINLHIDLFKEIRNTEGESVIFPEEGIDFDDSRYNLKLIELDGSDNYYIFLEDYIEDLEVLSDLATPQNPWIVLDNYLITTELLNEYLNTDYLLKVKLRAFDSIYFGYPADSGFVNQINRIDPILSLSNCLRLNVGFGSYVIEKIYHGGDILLSNLSQVEFISKADPSDVKIYNDIWEKRERGN